MLLPAIELALLYWALQTIELGALSWQALTRPIVICPLAGLLLGDLTTGCILGASLESLFMGISAIGGSIPSDWITTSFIAAAYVILTDADIDSAVAIAMPIGTVMAVVQTIPSVVFAPVQTFMTKLLEDHKIKSFEAGCWMITLLSYLLNAIVLFFAIYVGVEGIQTVMNAAPQWVMTGLSAVSSMVMAVGFAILVSQIITGETVIWFFVGFILVKYLSLDTLAVALLVAAAAIAIFFMEKKIAENKIQAEVVNNSEDEEDFF